MARRWVAVAVTALACGLFGCGSGGTGSTNAGASPGAGGTGDPSDDQLGDGSGGTSSPGSSELASVDACDFLSTEWLAANIEFEFGASVWEERPGALGECTWHNSSKLLNVRLSLWMPEARDLATALDEPPSTVTAEAVPSPEGAVLWRDASNDSAWQVWFPAGAAVGHIVQDLLMIDEEGLLAIAAQVAANAGTPANGGGAAQGANSCDAVWSCSTRSDGLLVDCVERSWGAGEDAAEACEAQVIGDLQFSYSSGPCERALESSGCLLREDARCQVNWLYGEGPRDFFEQQCEAQGHEVVGL